MPLGERGDAFEHLDGALVRGVEIFQPECERIGAGRRRKFI